MKNNEAAVHVLQQIELALKDVVDPVWKVLVGVSVVVFVLDHCGAGVDQTAGRDHSELFDFTGQKYAGWRHQKGVNALQGIQRVEPFKEDRCRSYDLKKTGFHLLKTPLEDSLVF